MVILEKFVEDVFLFSLAFVLIGPVILILNKKADGDGKSSKTHFKKHLIIVLPVFIIIGVLLFISSDWGKILSLFFLPIIAMSVLIILELFH